MDVGLLIVRIVVGLLFVGHGTQKLFGWFGGHGINGTAGFMDSLGFRPAKPAAVAGGLAETAGGLLLAVGLLNPLAAVLIIGMMITAGVAAHAPNGLWGHNGGYELPLVYVAVAAGLAFAGPGIVSVDALTGMEVTGWVPGLAALVVGLVVGGLTLATRRLAPQPEPAEEQDYAEARR